MTGFRIFIIPPIVITRSPHCHHPACPGDPDKQFCIMQDRIYSVYILASKRNGTLYTGVTNDLVRCVYEHREKLAEEFTKKHSISLLVWHEEFSNIELAIRREKRIKKYPRRWKLNLIEQTNPEWLDLWDEIVGWQIWITRTGLVKPWITACEIP